MVKTILREVKEYKAPSIATPIFMILEVIMEMMVPFLMASIIDNGVNAGDIGHIYTVGATRSSSRIISGVNISSRLE